MTRYNISLFEIFFCLLFKNHRYRIHLSFVVPFMSRFDHLSTYFCLLIRFDCVSIKRLGNMFLITFTWSNIVNSMSEGLSYCCLTLTLYIFSYIMASFSLKFIYTNTEHTEGTKTLVWQAFVRLMFQLSFHYLAIEWHLNRQLHTHSWVKTPVPRLLTSTNNI
jgi:hypothetical protein